MRALVAGGAGFIGSHLVDALLARGDEVVVVDDLSTGRRENLVSASAADLRQIDIRDRQVLDRVFAEFRPEAVFHLAALARIQPSFAIPDEYHDVNVTGTFNLLWAAGRHGARKFVFSASSSVYGAHPPEDLPLREDAAKLPASPYAFGKLLGERLVEFYGRQFGLETVSLRYFNVYGERQLATGAYATVVGIFLDQFRAGRPFTIVGDGGQRRDFTHVGDVVRAILLAAAPGRNGTFNIGTGRDHAVKEVADMISPSHPRRAAEARQGEAPAVRADNRAAREQLGWAPRTELADWLRSQTVTGPKA